MNDDEQISVLRVVEVTIACAALFLLAGAWAWGWARGSGLMAVLWYGG